MNFYISLPSNNKSIYFTENTTSDYSTMLQFPIKFNSSYKVGLAELIYNQSWNVNLGEFEIIDNLDDEIFKTKVTIDMIDGSSIFNVLTKLNFELKRHCIMYEYYKRRLIAMKIDSNSKEEIIKIRINENDSIASLQDNPPNKKVLNDIEKTLNIDSKLNFINHKINFTIRKKMKLKFSEKLQLILHLNKLIYDENDNESEDIIINDNMKLVRTLYVYTDIIKYQYVGETYAPLLRNVVVKTEFLNPVSVIFENPHYLELNKSEVSSINISIKDEFGDNIKFIEGSVIVKLHFKPDES